MRRSSDNRSQLTSFLVGVAFCFVGMILLIYLAKDIVIDTIRETKAPDQVTESPIPEDDEALPNKMALTYLLCPPIALTSNSVVAAAPLPKNNRKPTPINNSDAIAEFHLEAINNAQISHNKQNNIPKPDLPPEPQADILTPPPPLIQRSGDKVEFQSKNGGTVLIQRVE